MRVPRGILGRVDQHCRVLVKGDIGAVLAAQLLLAADDDGRDDLAFLDRATGTGHLDRADDRVADPGITPVRTALDPDAQQLTGAGVVSNL